MRNHFLSRLQQALPDHSQFLSAGGEKKLEAKGALVTFLVWETSEL